MKQYFVSSRYVTKFRLTSSIGYVVINDIDSRTLEDSVVSRETSPESLAQFPC